ncbi:hypothetical protein [Glaciihabitans sp. UYNi722]|uniref:hypothetical protein n=1 Tax=Glaciihabitans sp. UYNi722 TaxID=3156344 RepID=UPI003394BB0A
MNRDRIITLGIIGAIVVVGVLGWFIGASPILSQASAADDQRSSLLSVNDINQSKITLLKKQFAAINTVQKDLDTLRTSVPSDEDMAVFLREINTYGSQFGVSLTSVTVSDAAKYVAPAAPVTVPTPAASNAPTPTPTPTPTGSAATPATPTVPSSKLVVIPVTIVVSGTYANVMSFAGAIQGGPRLFLVSTLTTTSGEKGFTGSIVGTAYALPAPDATPVAK